MLDDFQKKVVAVAAIILLLSFASTYYLLNYANKSDTWPPSINVCPDFWSYNSDTQMCTNTHGLGNYSTTPKDISFNAVTAVPPSYNGNSPASITTNCGKYCYAQTYNIPWGGISYGYTNMPCST